MKVHTVKECMHSYSAREKGDHVCGLNQLKLRHDAVKEMLCEM